jgi:hypothetical protein
MEAYSLAGMKGERRKIHFKETPGGSQQDMSYKSLHTAFFQTQIFADWVRYHLGEILPKTQKLQGSFF